MSSNIFNRIRNLIAGEQKESSDRLYSATIPATDPERYAARELREARAKAPSLEKMFGKDFLTFFYGNGKDFQLSDEFLKAIGFSNPELIYFNNEYWETKKTSLYE